MNFSIVPLLRSALICAGISAASPVASAFADPTPDGRFCGELLSGGRLVEAVSEFETDRDGKIAGAYEFDDRGKKTAGTVREIDAGSGKRTRILLWRDRYGEGRLVVTFDQAYDSFEGRWGLGPAKPRDRWSGKRCAPRSIS